MLKLYDYELSGNCYKIRLLLNMLAVPYERQCIDFYPGGEHKSAEFLRINPLGQLPVLTNGELVLADSQAILVYLAAQYDTSNLWYPQQEPEQLGQISYWLSFASELGHSAGAARLQQSFNYDFDLAACQERAHQLLRVLDEHLWFQQHQQRDWLCSANAPTIADIACFPHIILCEEGGVSRLDYPAVRLWCDQVKRIPKFITMPGVFPTSAARGDS